MFEKVLKRCDYLLELSTKLYFFKGTEKTILLYKFQLTELLNDYKNSSYVTQGVIDVYIGRDMKSKLDSIEEYLIKEIEKDYFKNN